jgi:hypothetical protein
MRCMTRTWQHPEGWKGGGCVRLFERLMRAASRKSKGRPALVQAWDDGRGVVCWYNARAGLAERQLSDRCRVLFGAREREVV